MSPHVTHRLKKTLLSKKRRTILRTLGSSFFQKLIRILIKTNIKDPCTGMWLFNKQSITKLLPPHSDKMYFTLYLNLHLLKSKIPFHEFSINYDRITEQSKLNPYSDRIISLYTIIKYRVCYTRVINFLCLLHRCRGITYYYTAST